MSTLTKPTGVVLMTYGSATTSRDVDKFLHHVYPKASMGLIKEFERRFDVVGSSPLIQITTDQASALQAELDARSGAYLVEPGFLHTEPFIDLAVARLKKRGATRILGLLLSPQYSPHIMRGYDQALEAAAKTHGYNPSQATMLGPWATEPKFIELLATRLSSSREKLSKKHNAQIPVVFTTHSLPESVVKRDPSYLDQLSATVNAVVAKTNLTPSDWRYAYQSAGHSPEPWLKPDLNDVIADLRAQSVPAVLIVPIQFLADHLETLYDLDTAAREETEAGGVSYNRIEMPNTHPLLIEALANIAQSEPVHSTKKMS